MKIPNGKELYLAGVARREREERDLAVTPEQATALHMAREQAAERFARNYPDNISRALQAVESDGIFEETYTGQMSTGVLARMIDAVEAA